MRAASHALETDIESPVGEGGALRSELAPSPLRNSLARKGAIAGLASVLTASGAWLAWVALDRPTLGIDDADITLVYARNIAAGHGYVYTPGFERVEGSTSPLWTAVNALVAAFSERPTWPVAVLSWILTGTALALALEVGRVGLNRQGARVPAKAVAWTLAGLALWFACLPDFYGWNTLTLMDSALWTCAVSAFLSSCAYGALDPTPARMRWIAGAAALCAVTRPEALALCPAVLALLVLLDSEQRGLRAALRDHRLAIFCFLATTGALLLGRIAYFGYPFPNTYYAKMDPSVVHRVTEGLGYLKWYLSWRLWLVPFVVFDTVVVCQVVWKRFKGIALEPFERMLALLAGSVWIALLLPLNVGGDHFGSFRLYQPFAIWIVVPFLVWCGDRASSWGNWPVRALALAGLALVPWTWRDYVATHLLSMDFELSPTGQRVGKTLTAALSTAPRGVSPEPHLCAATPTWPRVGVIAAGGIAITYPGRVLDLVGLNWVEMAHSERLPGGARGHLAFNDRVFWRAKPELLVLIILDSTERAPASEQALRSAFVRGVMRGVLESARFRDEYEPAYLESGGSFVAGYFSKTYFRDCKPASYVKLAWN